MTRHDYWPWLRWTTVGALGSAALGIVLVALGVANVRIVPFLILLVLLLVLPEIIQNRKRRRQATWGSVAGCFVLTVLIAILWPSAGPPKLRLYYRNQELRGRIAYETPPAPIARCTSIIIDPNYPENFILCGIWARNVGEEPLTPNENVSVQLDFNIDVESTSTSSGWQRALQAEPGYRSEFRFGAGAGSLGRNQRWDLPLFWGKPAPAGDDLKVMISVFYGRGRTEQTFTLYRAIPKP